MGMRRGSWLGVRRRPKESGEERGEQADKKEKIRAGSGGEPAWPQCQSILDLVTHEVSF